MRPPRRTPGRDALADVDPGALASFRRRFRGDVVLPDDDGYGAARRVWNGLVNTYPAAVVRPTGVADVVAAVEFAAGQDLPVGVRAGGHNVSGSAVPDGALVVDCALLDGVRVDPERRTVRVGSGVRGRDLLRETQRVGLATSVGTAGDTGVAGATLGGGISWLRRKHGLAVDTLRSVDLVTAAGEVVTASPDRNPGLFWGVRGAGGSFGVVTSLEFALHPVGPDVATAAVFYPGEDAADVLRAYRSYAADAPDEVTTMAFCTTAPDDDEVPAAARGEPAVGVMAVDAGDVDAGTERLAPFRELADPLVDYSGVRSFVDVHDLDALYPHGRYYHWTSLFLGELDDDCVDGVVARAAEAPSPLSGVTVWQLGGAVGRVPADETVFPGRDAAYLLSVEASWDDPAACADNLAWARETRGALAGHSTGRSYVNFPGLAADAREAGREVYGDAYDRLVDLKRRYDPDGLFSGPVPLPSG